MKRIFLFSVFLLILLTKVSFATPQSPDTIIYNNKVLDLFEFPLENYYKNKKDKPKFFTYPHSTFSNNWRGYTAIWEIIEGKLFLRGLDSWICNPVTEIGKSSCHRADLKELFDKKTIKGKVFASWFTGDLIISDGALLEHFDEASGFNTPYEREIIIKVEAGKTVSQKIIDNIKKENL